jgi:hypothetical protein
MLMSRLCQSSYTIETPDETTWYSRREDEVSHAQTHSTP